MTEPNTYGYKENVVAATGPGQAPQGSGVIPMAQYKFSPDELRVLNECNKESFFQRSVPIGTVFGLGTYAAVQQGFLRPNARFGAFPKMSLAVIVGYFIGKLSYQQACAEKLMSLPGSYIGQLLRDKRDGKMGERKQFPGPSKGNMLGAGPTDIYSDAGMGSSLDLDTDRPAFNDDAYRPDNTASPDTVPESKAQPSLSYDELRRQNRNQFSDTKQDPYRVETVPPRPRAPVTPPPRTNLYGDSLD